MYKRLLQLILLLTAISLFTGCATSPIEKKVQYSQMQNRHLYDLNDWQLSGRIAMSNRHDSWTASIAWHHTKYEDNIDLAGPLGQGSAKIVLRPDLIIIDHGEGEVGYSEDVDFYIQQQLGFEVPVSALRFWILGLPEPDKTFVKLDDGFLQSSWKVHFYSFMPVDDNLMPRKIAIENTSAKLKLVVDQWVINDK